MQVLALITLTFFAVFSFLEANAAPPSAEQITNWSPPDIKDLGPEQRLSNVVPVTLKGGEQAFLAGVAYQRAGRNFWAGYLLGRPSLREARALDEFGGQYNGIQLVDPHLPSTARVPQISLNKFEARRYGMYPWSLRVRSSGICGTRAVLAWCRSGKACARTDSVCATRKLGCAIKNSVRHQYAGIY